MTPSTLELKSDFESIRAIGPWLTDYLEALGPKAAGAAGSIELALHELATNSVDHAKSSTLTIEALASGTAVEVTLRDNGSPFVGRSEPAPDPAEPQVRGYGLMIIESIAESVDYLRLAEENVWTMRFSVAADEN